MEFPPLLSQTTHHFHLSSPASKPSFSNSILTAELFETRLVGFLSFFIVLDRLSVVEVSFCGLMKGISPNICMLYVRAKINKCSFEPFSVWFLF